MTDERGSYGKVLDTLRQLFRQTERVRNSVGKTVSEGASKLTHCEIALMIIGGRKIRSKYFVAGMLGEPAWDIILDLYVSHCRGEAVDYNNACLASGVSTTTALRYVDALYGFGLLDRRQDHNDRGLDVITISDHGLERIEAYLDAYSAWVVAVHRPEDDVDDGEL